jgi:hypothetical protein
MKTKETVLLTSLVVAITNLLWFTSIQVGLKDARVTARTAIEGARVLDGAAAYIFETAAELEGNPVKLLLGENPELVVYVTDRQTRIVLGDGSSVVTLARGEMFPVEGGGNLSFGRPDLFTDPFLDYDSSDPVLTGDVTDVIYTLFEPDPDAPCWSCDIVHSLAPACKDFKEACEKYYEEMKKRDDE